jgi:hypothetical protein
MLKFKLRNQKLTSKIQDPLFPKIKLLPLQRNHQASVLNLHKNIIKWG